MAYEVECKVPIPRHRIEALTRLIDDAFPSFEKKAIDKRDVYYSRDGLSADFRVREENSAIVLTRKHKENRDDGAEVNQEVEFTVDRESKENVHSFFSSLGYRPLIGKGKHGTLWHDGSLSIELVLVDGLGYFLEMERLLEDSATEDKIDSALGELSRLRHLLGVSDIPLEQKYYIELLQEKNS